MQWDDGRIRLMPGDCRDLIAMLPDNSVDSVVTDPPYEIGFMNLGFDSTGIASDVILWKDILRVLKPGGHVAAFAASRTYHRLACTTGCTQAACHTVRTRDCSWTGNWVRNAPMWPVKVMLAQDIRTPTASEVPAPRTAARRNPNGMRSPPNRANNGPAGTAS